MAFGNGVLTLLLFIPVTILSRSWWISEPNTGITSLRRSSFPAGFVFGTASSAYQYEGAAREGGRGPSIWDTFTHKHPEKIIDRSNGDVAVDSYHRYKEDVSIVKEMGWDAFRISISWTRILPNGSLSGGVNEEGIKYYNNLIDNVISNGLQPWVTLVHYDHPQSLEDKYGGFLSYNIIQDFRDYADVCFKEFGDRVKHWITFNEPFKVCVSGYSDGSQAPGRCSSWEAKCSAGDSGREPYIVCHHLLLAHATAVELYRHKYQGNRDGQIGMKLVGTWFLPYSDSQSDISAVERALDFEYGWFMNPLTQGNYPLSMEDLVGDRLPKFSKNQSELMKGSFDFIGINYYSSKYVYSLSPSTNVNTSYSTDSHTKKTAFRDGAPIGPKAASDWLYIYPPGIREILLYTKSKYNNPIIYITENGVDELDNKTSTLEEALNDLERIDFHHEHLLYCRRAISEGVNVRGYFAWSLLDNYEWEEGYTVRFGMYFVDRNNGLKRYPKKSALWFRRFLAS